MSNASLTYLRKPALPVGDVDAVHDRLASAEVGLGPDLLAPDLDQVDLAGAECVERALQAVAENPHSLPGELDPDVGHVARLLGELRNLLDRP